MTTLNQDQLNQVELLYKHYKKTNLTRSEINDFIKIGNIKNPSWLKQDQFKVARGVYALPIDGDISPKVKEDIIAELPKTETAPVNETVNQAAFIVSSLTEPLWYNSRLSDNNVSIPDAPVAACEKVNLLDSSSSGL